MKRFSKNLMLFLSLLLAIPVLSGEKVNAAAPFTTVSNIASEQLSVQFNGTTPERFNNSGVQSVGMNGLKNLKTAFKFSVDNTIAIASAKLIIASDALAADDLTVTIGDDNWNSGSPFESFPAKNTTYTTHFDAGTLIEGDYTTLDISSLLTTAAAAYSTPTEITLVLESSAANAYNLGGIDDASSEPYLEIHYGAALDLTPPTITGAVHNSNTQITVALSEDSQNLSHANNGGFTVYQTDNPGITYPVTFTAPNPGADKKHIVLAVTNMAAAESTGVTVTYTEGGNGNLQDLAGNPLATNGVGIVIPSWDVTPPTITGAVRNSDTQITVALSENAKNLAKGNSGGFTVEEAGSPGITYTVSSTAQGADAQHVVLTVSNMAVSGKEGVIVKYTVGGNGTIADMANNVLATDSGGRSITGWDTVVPTITGVTRNSDTQITVTLSENAANLAKANDGGFTAHRTGNAAVTYAVTATAQGADAQHVVLTVDNLANSGASGVTVNYTAGGNGTITDIAGNALASASNNIVAWDIAAPTISSAIRDNDTQITVTLSENAVNLAKANDGGFIVHRSGDAGVTYAVTATAQGADAQHIVLTVDNLATSGANGVTVKYTAGGNGTIADIAGNPLANSAGVGIIGWDLSAPTITGVTRDSNTQITVTLSEASVNLAKGNDGGFVVHEAGNPAVTYAVTAITQGADAQHVVLTVADLAISAKEGVTVKYTAGGNGTIADIAGNAMANNSAGITGWDSTAPAITSGTVGPNNAYIDIVLDEGVYGSNNGADPLDVSDLSLTFLQNGGNATAASIASVKKIDGATLAGGETTVRVFLTITGNPSGTETIEISPSSGTAVYDLAGNASSALTTTGAKTLFDKHPPTLISAVRTNMSQITVTLSENAVNLVNANDGGFIVHRTGDAGVTYTVLETVQGVDARHIVLTVSGMATSGAVGVTVKYTAGGNGAIEDGVGNAMATDGTGVNVPAWDLTGPTIIDATRDSNTQISIKLSEDSVIPDQLNDGGFTVHEIGNPAVTYEVTAIERGTNDLHVVLSVANVGVSAKEGLTVKYTAGGNGTIKDIAGNAMLTDGIGRNISGWDTAGPTIAGITAGVGNDYVDLSFGEGVYGSANGTGPLTASDLTLAFLANGGTATAVTIAGVSKTDGATVASASALTGGETTVRVFLSITGEPSGTETIEITPADGSSVYDLAGNASSISETTNAKGLSDKLAPTITGAVRNSDTQITVTLSEDAANLTKANNGGFSVHRTGEAGATYAIIATAQGADAQHVVLWVANLETSGANGVTVKYTAGGNGTIEDLSGNAMSTNGAGAIIAGWDLAAPTITGATRDSNTQITVVLSKHAVNLTNASNGGFIVHETGNPAVTYAVTATARGADAKHVVLTVASLAVSGKEGITVKYTAGGNGTIADFAGTALATDATGVTVAAWDLVAPTISGATRDNNTQITVTLSENAANLLKANNGGFTVHETGNVAVTYTVTATAQGADTQHVVLTVANLGVSAQEGITVKYTAGGNGTIEDIAGNAMATDTTGTSIAGWDVTAPTITGATVGTSNVYVDVTLSEGAYSANNGTGALDATDFALTFAQNAGGAAAVTIAGVKKNNAATLAAAGALTGGETTIRVFLTVTGTASGVETIEIKPASGSSIYDLAGNAAATSQTTGAKKLQDTRPSPGGGGGSPGTGDKVIIIVNGKVQDSYATAEVETVNGQKVTTVTLDPNKLQENLASGGSRPVVTIPVNNKSDIVIGELDADTIKTMENKNAVLEIKTEQATYTLPAKQIDVDDVAKQFGTQVALEDIKIQVKVEVVPDSEVKFGPLLNGHTVLVAPAVEYTITAEYGGKEVEVDRFKAYVERTIAIPDGVDPKKITTGIVLSDGRLQHVPTKIVQIDGKYYAVIKSLTNSTYSVIYNEKTFDDIKGHWAQASIEDMSARLVISGMSDTSFQPNRDITRAEFTSIVTRALGLRVYDQATPLTDVKQGDWYYDSVQIGIAYGLVQGYEDSSFHPNQNITREEAIVIVYRAMALAEIDVTVVKGNVESALAPFADQDTLHSWARDAAAANVHYGVIGDYNGKLSPSSNITRAETAVIIQRLLQKAGFI